MAMHPDLTLDAPLPAAVPAGGRGAGARPRADGTAWRSGHRSPVGVGAPASGRDSAEAAPSPGSGKAGGAQATHTDRRSHVHNGWVDFLTLGGGSLIVLAALAAFYPRDDAARAILASTALVLAFFLTYPHVAHSYQLFYRGFLSKAFSPESVLASRYRIAGVVIPVAMVVFFAVALARDSLALLGLAGNVTLLMSGWHYAKQGFGILMLDAARKGVRFSAGERKRLLWNTHLIWVTFWLMINDTLVTQEMWGITYYLIDVPESLRTAMLVFVVLSALLVGYDFLRKWRAERTLPVNGIVAYAATVYAWVLIGRFDPVLLLVVPLFHGLQYLSVVWRYRLNMEDAQLHARAPGAEGGESWLRTTRAGLVRFALVGGGLGGLLFWVGPTALDTLVSYDRAIFGAALFFFIGWTFVGIHHAVMDNVIWRRENVDSRRYLFEAWR